MVIVQALCIHFGFGVCSKTGGLGKTSLGAIKSAPFVAAVALEEHNRSKSRGVLGRPCSANWYGSKDRVFRAGVAPNAHGCSTLQDHPPAIRSMK